MALTVVTTPGASNANSYASVVEGDAYHDGHAHAADWTGATTAQKGAALVMATRLLDVMWCWENWPSATTQALQWPRQGMLDVLGLSIIASTVIPQRLKDATAEYARQILAADRSADNQVETQGLTDLSVGSISLSFREGVTAKPVPDAVLYMIPTWWGYVRGARIFRAAHRA